MIDAGLEVGMSDLNICCIDYVMFSIFVLFPVFSIIINISVSSKKDSGHLRNSFSFLLHIQHNKHVGSTRKSREHFINIFRTTFQIKRKFVLRKPNNIPFHYFLMMQNKLLKFIWRAQP